MFPDGGNSKIGVFICFPVGKNFILERLGAFRAILTAYLRPNS